MMPISVAMRLIQQHENVLSWNSNAGDAIDRMSTVVFRAMGRTITVAIFPHWENHSSRCQSREDRAADAMDDTTVGKNREQAGLILTSEPLLVSILSVLL